MMLTSAISRRRSKENPPGNGDNDGPHTPRLSVHVSQAFVPSSHLRRGELDMDPTTLLQK